MVYRIRQSLDSKEVGKYPQSEDSKVPTTIDDPLYTDNLPLRKADRYLAPKPILTKRAKITDLISAVSGTSRRLLISDTLKSILEIYSGSMQYFNTSVIYKGEEIEDYWLTNPFEFDYDAVDFSRSTVTIEERMSTEPPKPITITSPGEFAELVEKVEETNLYPFIKTVHFLPPKKHFFVLRSVPGGVGYYVSEKLKNQIEDAGCTGIRFKPSDEEGI